VEVLEQASVTIVNSKRKRKRWRVWRTTKKGHLVLKLVFNSMAEEEKRGQKGISSSCADSVLGR